MYGSRCCKGHLLRLSTYLRDCSRLLGQISEQLNQIRMFVLCGRLVTESNYTWNGILSWFES
jgi:hypothetical protein